MHANKFIDIESMLVVTLGFGRCKHLWGSDPKGDQSWMFIGGTDVEAETPILWPPDGES